MGTAGREYITIAEYAEARGVSTAAVYKRLEKGLKPWYRVVNGKKCLLSSVLKEERANGFINVDKKEVEYLTNVDNAEESPIVKELRAQIAQLQADAAAQRAAIQEKDKQLEERAQQITDFAARFAELAARNAELVDQAHKLHAAQLTDGQPEAIAAPVVDIPAAGEEKKKRGRLARFLFGE